MKLLCPQCREPVPLGTGEIRCPMCGYFVGIGSGPARFDFPYPGDPVPPGFSRMLREVIVPMAVIVLLGLTILATVWR